MPLYELKRYSKITKNVLKLPLKFTYVHYDSSYARAVYLIFIDACDNAEGSRSDYFKLFTNHIPYLMKKILIHFSHLIYI